MQKPTNVYQILEELFSEQRDSTFEAEVLNDLLLDKARQVINAELIERS